MNASGRKGVWAARNGNERHPWSPVKGGETHLKGEETAFEGDAGMRKHDAFEELWVSMYPEPVLGDKQQQR